MEDRVRWRRTSPGITGFVLLFFFGAFFGPFFGGAQDLHAASFRREVMAVLTRAGCNSGTCHGTPAGKNGFRLSLRGYDPEADFRVLTRELGGRRVSLLEPEKSLILLKPTLEVPHEGGRKLEKGSASHRLLLDWVREGAKDDGASLPSLMGLRLLPEGRVLRRAPGGDPAAWSIPLAAAVRFADGTERDVTHLVRFSVSDETVAAVTPEGVVEGRARGEVAAAAEYLGRQASARLTFVEDDPSFVWRDSFVWPASLDSPEGGSLNFIDRHVFAKLELLRIPPSPEAAPEELLRRMHFDLTGVPPTPEEVRRWLADPSPARRAKLIDDLLERPEFAELWGMRYADRLGCNQRFVGQMGAYKYHAWVVDAMAANVPEDTLAWAIVTASGGNYSRPAAGFYRRLRDPGSAAEAVAQLFLGVRLQCARCHNHPGESWTQDDYLGMAAFFSGLRFKDGPYFNHVYDKEETVFVDRRAPSLSNPRTGSAVAARFLGGPAAQVEPGADPRDALAGWLTDRSNPLFARVAANRIWYHVFGRGIVEPVDDFRGSNPPANDELLEALAADFAANGFDRKRLLRTILMSRTYALGSRPLPANAADEKYFSHAQLRLLPAEVLLDAISAATGVSERFEGLPPDFRAAQVPDGEYAHRFLTAFGRPARAMACECERDTDTNLSQALHLVGGETVQRKIRTDGGRVARLLASGAAPRAIVDELFLASLARLPTAEEMDGQAEKLETAPDRRRAAEDLLWALLNHPEFLYRH